MGGAGLRAVETGLQPAGAGAGAGAGVRAAGTAAVSGAGVRGAGARPGPRRGKAAWSAWAELLRVSALFTVPGDALAGAAAAGVRPNRATLLAIGSSLCLYEAGMALNDWADRAEDAVDRPHRPIPSGRISPRAALVASAALTAAGLGLAARAGRPALAVAAGLAATVWSYDLHLKHTAAGPAAMAAARALDLLLGATATGGPPSPRPLPSAALLAAHTYAITAVSRHEAHGGSTRAPLLALAATLTVAAGAAGLGTVPRPGTPQGTTGRTSAALPFCARRREAASRVPAPRPHFRDPAVMPPAPDGDPPTRWPDSLPRLVTAALAVAYARTPAPAFLHAALNPSPPLTQRAVGAGIRALIPLQAALAARSGAPGTAVALLTLAPLARSLARKVSPT
ncbi:SCO3242 family prenyltransferase [Streptomyces sp. NPDC006551]|uniref:SCO3242 family prenyltransferase n=1 Tax=Streptomyces sp. NPDC006551 TaxID=3157178 RepID=UPI0033AC2F3C